MFIFFLFFFVINLFTCNLVLWWGIFLGITILFVMINKHISANSIISYFVVQEFFGFLFILLNFYFIQFVILLMKAGISPFHFWVFSVVGNLSGFSMVWFLTFQKFPFIPVIFQLYDGVFFLLFVVGILFCYLQLFFVKSYKFILTISSIESFNWLCIIIFVSAFSGLIFSVFYLMFFFFVLDYSNSKSTNFFNWEIIFVFINIPFSMTFFIKIFSLVGCFEHFSFFIFIVLFLMFLSVFSIGFWLLNIRSKFFFSGIHYKFNTFLFLFYPLMFFLLI